MSKAENQFKKSLYILKNAVAKTFEEEKDGKRSVQGYPYKTVTGVKGLPHDPEEAREVLTTDLFPRLMLTYDLTETDFNKSLEIVKQRRLQVAQDRQKRLEEAEAAQIKYEKPENAIPRAYFGRKAYPRHYREAVKKYSLTDFQHVRQLLLDGQLKATQGDPETVREPFLLWLNAVIDTKRGN